MLIDQCGPSAVVAHARQSFPAGWRPRRRWVVLSVLAGVAFMAQLHLHAASERR
jgi:hypothetical protein